MLKKNTIQELLKLLISELTTTQRKPLGFDDIKPPNKKWLIKVLYSINPNLDIFNLTQDICFIINIGGKVISVFIFNNS